MSVSVVLVIQHAMRMRHIDICGLCGCAIFSYYKRHDFRKKGIEHKCVL